MLTMIEKLKKQMELQIDVDIFMLTAHTMFDRYGVTGAREYSALRLCCFYNDYIINKNVFDEYNNEKIKDVMWMLHNAWRCATNIDATENKIKNKIESGICLDLCVDIDEKFKYYIELNHLYKHILHNITKCKTLLNKRYKQQTN